MVDLASYAEWQLGSESVIAKAHSLGRKLAHIHHNKLQAYSCSIAEPGSVLYLSHLSGLEQLQRGKCNCSGKGHTADYNV